MEAVILQKPKSAFNGTLLLIPVKKCIRINLTIVRCQNEPPKSLFLPPYLFIIVHQRTGDKIDCLHLFSILWSTFFSVYTPVLCCHLNVDRKVARVFSKPSIKCRTCVWFTRIFMLKCLFQSGYIFFPLLFDSWCKCLFRFGLLVTGMVQYPFLGDPGILRSEFIRVIPLISTGLPRNVFLVNECFCLLDRVWDMRDPVTLCSQGLEV